CSSLLGMIWTEAAGDPGWRNVGALAILLAALTLLVPLPRVELPAPWRLEEKGPQEGSAPAPDVEALGPRLSGASPAEASARPRACYPPSRLSQVRRLRRWGDFLRAWKGLPAAIPPAARAAEREGALAGVADPVVRQNVIFAATLLHPWDEVRPWLQALQQGPDPADAEDALCARAFSGDAQALPAFEALSRQPSGAAVHLLDWPDEHDALAAQGTDAVRASLRAYRAVEVLDRRLYFHLMPFLVTGTWDEDTARGLLGFQPRPAPDVRRDEALLRAWLARYPGHPGTDGMCLRIARVRVAEGRVPDAAEWFARCLAGPDQDRAHRARAPLVMLAERLLSIDELGVLAEASGAATPSRTLFRYARLRRLAVERGPQAACQAAALQAQGDEGVLGWAWRARLSSPVPRGLSSGVTPLPAGDSLREVQAAPEGRPAPVLPPDSPGEPPSFADLLGVQSSRGWGEAGRAAPPQDPWHLDAERLARQFRAWATLAELERRTDAARGAARADLLYKQAAVLYHDRDVFFPCYGTHSANFGWALSALDDRDDTPAAALPAAPSLQAYAQRAFSWERALLLFARIEREHPDYAALDKVLFSTGMCLKRLVDYRPRNADERFAGDAQRYGADRPAWWRAVQGAVAAFERVAREHPSSTLADDAARAAAYWRREYPRIFEPAAR
ncbi:MAG: hypothetical protein ACKOSS_02230, partial [Planctomycetia bacterium]